MEKLQRKYTHETNCTKKFKSTKLHIDEEVYKEVRNIVQKLIRKKKKAYFEEKLKENLENLKKFSKTLKQLQSFIKYLSWEIAHCVKSWEIAHYGKSPIPTFQ